MFIADKRLFVIGQDERSSRELARDMRRLCSVEFKGLNQGIIRPLARPDGVVLGGVTFGSSNTTRKVGRALEPFLEQGIPVLCLLDDPSPRDELQARVAGADEVLPSSGTPIQAVATRMQALLRSGNRRDRRRRRDHHAAIDRVTRSLADLLTAAGSGRPVSPTLAADAGALLLRVLDSASLSNWMVAIADMHDPTYRHSLVMAGVMGAFMLHLGVGARDCQRMVSGALLHDIGKALVPAEIVDKPAPLLTEEMAVMRTHPSLGHELLVAQGGHDDLTLQIVRSHHERLDGSGYPDKLRGEQVTDPIRIASLCDVFVALVEARSYKPAMTTQQALDLMADMGGRLDMTLLAAFRQMFSG